MTTALGKRPHILLMESPTLITDSECSKNVEIEAYRDLTSFVYILNDDTSNTVKTAGATYRISFIPK
jgi:hypothetical protein